MAAGGRLSPILLPWTAIAHFFRQAASRVMTLQDILIFVALIIALSLAAHWFVRRYRLAVLISITACSLVNIVHEAYLHDFQIRPADVVFWIPMLFFQGMSFALPLAALVGIPFYVIRRRRHTNAT
jgi:hypothetical protein